MKTESQANGACLCGAVGFVVTFPSMYCAHCHCTMCQRNHGAGYVTWFSLHDEQLTVISGADRLVSHASSEHGTRQFCGNCGSSLFCRNNLRPGHVDIPLANMNQPIDREPQMHVYYDDRASWVTTDDGLPRLGGKTGLEPVDSSGADS